MWLIGSQAYTHLRRPQSDYDFIASPEELEQLRAASVIFAEDKWHVGKYAGKIDNCIVDIDATSNASARMMYNCEHGIEDCIEDEIIWKGIHTLVPNLSTLWLFKRSHAGYPIHPAKTLSHLITLTEDLHGDDPREILEMDWLTPFQLRLYSALRSEVKARHEKRDRRMNFNKPAKDFFKSSQSLREYQHDALHEATCRYEFPIYKRTLIDPDKALVSMKKFMQDLTFDERITMVQEEIVVIAIERFYLNNRNISADVLYRRGMEKFITDLCKGDFQDYVLNNIHHIYKPRWDFLSKFHLMEQQIDRVNTSNAA